MSEKGRFGFRSDTRDPSTIFKEGFKSREMDCSIEEAYRPSELLSGHTIGQAGDIDPKKAVCLSARVSAAALFPWGEDKKTNLSNVYLCFVPEKEVFNTHIMQIQDALEKAQQGDPGGAYWAIYAHEFAVKKIRPHHVLAAVMLIRDKADQYLLGPYPYHDKGTPEDAKANVAAIQWNKAAFAPLLDEAGKVLEDQETWWEGMFDSPGLPAKVQEAAKEFFNKEVALSKWQPRAKPESGWHGPLAASTGG